MEPLDLLIVGAGLSAVDMAHHVHKNFPNWNWAVVDSNSDIGGTWNTFTYPGIRSDSDMATFALPFKRWPHKGTLGSGAQIKEYTREAAEECGMLDRLELSTWVQRINFHTEKGLWEVTALQAPKGTDNSEGRAAMDGADHDGVEQKIETKTYWAKWVHLAAGYYRHSSGFTPTITGIDDFQGTVIHPQRWPDNLDVSGKRVVVVGSGATAVTLMPALHEMGARATMLQRTPTYIAPLPNDDRISKVVGLGFNMEPGKRGHTIARNLHIFRDMFQYHFCQTFPWVARKYFWAMNRQYISGAEIKKNFTPPYNPWDQRVCKSPDGDFFRALKDGASVVTGAISTVTADGIDLIDGRHIPADIIVTATGLQLQPFGNLTFAVDGQDIPTKSLVAYRSMLGNRLPNVSYTIGYLNQSWTLRADMTSRYLVKLWQDMRARGDRWAAPVLPEGVAADRPMLEMGSGYIQRSIDELPRQGAADPWRMEHDYIKERRTYLSQDNTKDMVFGQDALDAAAVLARTASGGGAEVLQH